MNQFYAYLSRMKYIMRWGLMRNTQQENDMEHAFQTALIAHGIAVLAKVRFDREVDCEHVLALALFHDAGEVITGDLPTPVKYHNPYLKTEYHKLEAMAADKLMHMLPEDMQGEYAQYLRREEQSYSWRLVKAADKICAYIKCLEEEKAGNLEFAQAKESTCRAIEAIDLPEVQAFMAEFVPSFSLSLDQLSQEGGSL